MVIAFVINELTLLRFLCDGVLQQRAPCAKTSTLAGFCKFEKWRSQQHLKCYEKAKENQHDWWHAK
eukprot:SAG31_NODE_296_length_18227_cov_39.663173_10_plen_66_part_00